MKQKKYSGFTLIEVLLVLAIGGSIIAMVFIALPGMMANQRDNERRDDMMYFINRLKNFQANNNRGGLPSPTSGTVEIKDINAETFFKQTTGTTWEDFYSGFFNSGFTDPLSGKPYNWKIVDCGTTSGNCSNGKPGDTFEANNYYMHIVRGATCDGPDAIHSANPRNVAVVYMLEKTGAFCANT